MMESILSDSNGQPIEHDSEGSTVEISGEEPPPEAPDTPTGLVASDGDSQVSVMWNASFGAEEYFPYREDQGNNGGDGYILARLAHQAGKQSAVGTVVGGPIFYVGTVGAVMNDLRILTH